MTTSTRSAPSVPPASRQAAAGHQHSEPGTDAAREPLRLLLSPCFGHGPLDGAWWPQSRDLEVELADLVDHFPASAGRIVRAVYCPPDWLSPPRRVKVARGFVKTGYFPHDDTHVISLRMYDQQILQLMVVPFATSAIPAKAAMRAAADPANMDSATALLRDLERADGVDPAAQWSDDGGAWSDHSPGARTPTTRVAHDPTSTPNEAAD